MKFRLCALGVLTLTLLSACQNPQQSSATPPHGAPPAVKIAQPVAQQVTEWDEFTGTIEAVDSVDVRARVSGYLEQVHVKDGEPVKQGELLFSIDPKPFTAQLNFAEAELRRAVSRRELAKSDLARAEQLFRAKAISAEEHDARLAALNETDAAVASAEANVYSARLNLEFTQIRAPIDGRIGREWVTKGNLISGGGADATLLTFIVSTDPVYVYVAADERSALKYRRLALQRQNQATRIPARLAVADEQHFPHSGWLDYLAPREDAATGTVSMRAVFSNPDGLLSPGFFARLRVRGSAPYAAILLPDKAIASDQGQRYVWVVKPDHQVEYRKVVLGAHIGRQRVIASGVGVDDWVVIEGVQKLKPGIAVAAERVTLSAESDEVQP